MPHSYVLGIHLLKAAYWEYLFSLPESFVVINFMFYFCFNFVVAVVLPEEHIQSAHRAN